MKVIKLDGTNICSFSRDYNIDKLFVKIFKNNTNKKSGDCWSYNEEDMTPPEKYDYQLEISKDTYIALCRTLLAYADRGELNKILLNPLEGSCWTITERKPRKKT